MMTKTSLGRRLGLGALICASIALSYTTASAASMAVEMACAADYYTHCSKHDPDSSATRSCMKAVGSRLSQRCIKALSAAGEIPSAKTERRASR